MRKNFMISILVGTVILGYTLVSLIGLEAARQTEQQQDGGRTADLVDVITGQEAEIDQLETSIEEIRQVIDDQRDLLSEDVGRLTTMRTNLENNRIFAGLSPIEGPGLVVVLNDNVAKAEAAKRALGPAFNPNDYLIHDKTLLYLINELKAARPEAVSINGQRLVTGSNIRCVGTVVLVNDTRLSPPYEISLVGDPLTLENVLRNAEEYQLLISREFPVTYNTPDVVEIPRYRGNYTPSIMEPYRPAENTSTAPAAFMDPSLDIGGESQ